MSTLDRLQPGMLGRLGSPRCAMTPSVAIANGVEVVVMVAVLSWVWDATRWTVVECIAGSWRTLPTSLAAVTLTRARSRQGRGQLRRAWNTPA